MVRAVRDGDAEVHEVRGFRVIVENSREDIRTNDVITRLDDSLALIERHQPWRLRHLERDLKQFLVARFPCRGAYFPEERTCSREMRDRAREERLCRRAELDFGRALPPELGRPVIERALGTLSLADSEVAPEIDWNEAFQRQQSVDRAAQS